MKNSSLKSNIIELKSFLELILVIGIMLLMSDFGMFMADNTGKLYRRWSESPFFHLSPAQFGGVLVIIAGIGYWKTRKILRLLKTEENEVENPLPVEANPPWQKSFLLTSLILLALAGMMLDRGVLFIIFLLADSMVFLLLLLLQKLNCCPLKRKIWGLIIPVVIMLTTWGIMTVSIK